MSKLLQTIHAAVHGDARSGFEATTIPALQPTGPDAAFAEAEAAAFATESLRCHAALSAPGILGNAVAMSAALAMLQASREMSGAAIAEFVNRHKLGSAGTEAMAASYERSRLAASAGEPGARGVAQPRAKREQARPDASAATIYARRRAAVADADNEAQGSEERVRPANNASPGSPALPDPSAVYARRVGATSAQIEGDR